MNERSRRQFRAPSREQLEEERFDTGGKSFEESLERVLAGGPDEAHPTQAGEQEADK